MPEETISTRRRGLVRGLLLLVLASVVLVPLSALADSAHDVKGLREKVETLEKRQSELYHTLEEKKGTGLMRKITERIAVGGLVEVEASVDSNDRDGDSSDVVLATVELGLDAAIHERVAAHVLFLWEEDTTDPIDLDEGTVEITPLRGLTITGGKFYIPFGVFNSHFITDPQVLELAETNESALMFTYAGGPFSVSAGVFNGGLDEAGSDDAAEDWFAGVTVVPVRGVEFGGYYTSDIGDSDVMTDVVLATTTVAGTVGGAGGYLSATYGPWTLDAEYVSATARFGAGVLDADSDGRGDRPRTFNVEVAFDVTRRVEVAAKLEGNRDFFTFPEAQYGVAASYGLYRNVALTVEYLHGEFSADRTTRDLVTAQVAVAF
ncbi:MAG: LbtU family siderophore porin [Thermodesulfobacteriota bacterium]